MYSFSVNYVTSVQISTFMCLWAIYIFPGSVHIFLAAEWADRLWEYIIRSQTHECVYWHFSGNICFKFSVLVLCSVYIIDKRTAHYTSYFIVRPLLSQNLLCRVEWISVYLLCIVRRQPPKTYRTFFFNVTVTASCTHAPENLANVYLSFYCCRQSHTCRRNLADVYLLCIRSRQSHTCCRNLAEVYLLCHRCRQSHKCCRNLAEVYLLCHRCGQSHTCRRNLAEIYLLLCHHCRQSHTFAAGTWRKFIFFCVTVAATVAHFCSRNLAEVYLLCHRCRQSHTFAAGTWHTDGYPLFFRCTQPHVMADLTRGWLMHISLENTKPPAAHQPSALHGKNNLCICCHQPHSIRLNLLHDLSTVHPIPPAAHHPPKLVRRFILCISYATSNTSITAICLTIIYFVSGAGSLTPSAPNLSNNLSSVCPMLPAAHHPPELVGWFILCVSDAASRTSTAGTCRTIYPLCIRWCQPHTNRRNLADMMLKAGNWVFSFTVEKMGRVLTTYCICNIFFCQFMLNIIKLKD